MPLTLLCLHAHCCGGCQVAAQNQPLHNTLAPRPASAHPICPMQLLRLHLLPHTPHRQGQQQSCTAGRDQRGRYRTGVVGVTARHGCTLKGSRQRCKAVTYVSSSTASSQIASSSPAPSLRQSGRATACTCVFWQRAWSRQLLVVMLGHLLWCERCAEDPTPHRVAHSAPCQHRAAMYTDADARLHLALCLRPGTALLAHAKASCRRQDDLSKQQQSALPVSPQDARSTVAAARAFLADIVLLAWSSRCRAAPAPTQTRPSAANMQMPEMQTAMLRGLTSWLRMLSDQRLPCPRWHSALPRSLQLALALPWLAGCSQRSSQPSPAQLHEGAFAPARRACSGSASAAGHCEPQLRCLKCDLAALQLRVGISGACERSTLQMVPLQASTLTRLGLVRCTELWQAVAVCVQHLHALRQCASSWPAETVQTLADQDTQEAGPGRLAASAGPCRGEGSDVLLSRRCQLFQIAKRCKAGLAGPGRSQVPLR